MKKYFRVVTKSFPPVCCDIEVPEQASLPNFMANVMQQGCVIQEKFFCPYEQIAHVSVITTVDQVQFGKPQLVN